MHLFRKTRFFIKSNSENHQNVGLFSHHCFLDFPYFFGVDVRIDFSWKMIPKPSQKASGAGDILATFSRPFPKVDFLMHFGCPLAHFWLPLGALWHPLAHFWHPFGFFLVSLGSLWVPFGSVIHDFMISASISA